MPPPRIASLRSLVSSSHHHRRVVNLRSARCYATNTTNTADNSHLLRNGLIATALLGAAGASYYYSQTESSEETHKTFITKIRTSKGMAEHHHELLSSTACSRRLHENELTKTYHAHRPTSVTRYDNNWLASNEPVEDRHAEHSIPRSMVAPTEHGEGLKMFSIFDGHGGTATSQLLSITLHPMLVLSLRSLYAGFHPEDPVTATDKRSTVSHIKAYISSLLSPVYSTNSKRSVTVDPSTISSSIISAFLTLDNQIITSPLRLIPHFPVKPGKPNIRPIVLPMIEPALSGSCAVSMLVDEEREELYVASTGDCRAVAGYWVQGQAGKGGKWRCEVLTEDQMGKNPNEVKRLQDEHPADEKDTVIMRGRVMGGLEPTRAFGDARYKWTKEQLESVNDLTKEGDGKRRSPIPLSKTPPYVTARPEVTYKSLRPSAEEGELKFVVLATDGLWDRISSTEAVALVGEHITNPIRPPVPAPSFTSTLSPSSPTSLSRYPPESESPSRGRSGQWVFEDDNAATHLIKNSLAGSDEKKRNELLSMRYPISRWLRDDITCTVVFFGSAPGTMGPAEPVKARL